MQNEFINPGPVLTNEGFPVPGYSTRSVLNYDRKMIKASPFRIKEWDFYQITDGRMCLQFTIGHASYAGQICAMLFDFKSRKKICEKGTLLALPFHSLKMPYNAEEDNILSYKKKDKIMKFETIGDKRKLSCKWEDFEAEIELTRMNNNSIIINIPFDESPTAFYYNHKINCMKASGIVKYKDNKYEFSSSDSFGLLDWGRGVWPFHNEWFWSNGTGYINNEIFGFNLGCGFGNTKGATENIIFYGDTVHKLGEVKIENEEDYMKPWHIFDLDGRLDLTLTPTYDRTTKTKVLWVDNCCHQMFGEFHGKVILDDNRVLEISNIISFAEHAINNW